MEGVILIREGIGGTRPFIRWEDGEEDDLHCGAVITLKDGREFRLEYSWESERWYLVRSGIKDIVGLIVKKEDE